MAQNLSYKTSVKYFLLVLTTNHNQYLQYAQNNFKKKSEANTLANISIK